MLWHLCLTLTSLSYIASCQPQEAPTEFQFVGHWKLVDMFVGPELREFPVALKLGNNGVNMVVEDQDDRRNGDLQLKVKVHNTFLFMVNTSIPSVSDGHFFRPLRITEGASTRTLGSAKQMEVETLLANNILLVDRWYAVDARLVIEGPTLSLTFVRTPTDQATSDDAFEYRRLSDKGTRHRLPPGYPIPRISFAHVAEVDEAAAAMDILGHPQALTVAAREVGNILHRKVQQFSSANKAFFEFLMNPAQALAHSASRKSSLARKKATASMAQAKSSPKPAGAQILSQQRGQQTAQKTGTRAYVQV